MAAAAPTAAPEPQGNSIGASGSPAPGPTTPADPMSAPPALQAPPSQFAPKATGSANQAVNDYKMGVLQATAAGGMAQQKAFNDNHQAIVDARSGALQNTLQRSAAAAGGGAAGAGLAAAVSGRSDPGMGIQVGNSSMQQADFKSAAAQRGSAFSNYMNEVQAAIPLAQAAAYQSVQDKYAAQKAASVQTQYDNAVGVGQQQMTADTAARAAATDEATTKLQPIQQQMTDLETQYSQMAQDYHALQNAKGLKQGPTALGGLPGGRFMVNGNTVSGQDLVKMGQQMYTKMQAMQKQHDTLKQQVSDINAGVDAKAPAPKGLQDYVSGLVGGSSAALQGKAALGAPSLQSGQDRLTLASASDVARIKSAVPGLSTKDAQAVAADPTYKAAVADARAGLTAAVDNRGRLKGTTTTPWDAFVAHMQTQVTDPSAQAAIIKQFEPLYRAAGRTSQQTAKQLKAKA